jgi:hypothetical protein
MNRLAKVPAVFMPDDVEEQNWYLVILVEPWIDVVKIDSSSDLELLADKL